MDALLKPLVGPVLAPAFCGTRKLQKLRDVENNCTVSVCISTLCTFLAISLLPEPTGAQEVAST